MQCSRSKKYKANVYRYLIIIMQYTKKRLGKFPKVLKKCGFFGQYTQTQFSKFFQKTKNKISKKNLYFNIF